MLCAGFKVLTVQPVGPKRPREANFHFFVLHFEEAPKQPRITLGRYMKKRVYRGCSQYGYILYYIWSQLQNYSHIITIQYTVNGIQYSTHRLYPDIKPVFCFIHCLFWSPRLQFVLWVIHNNLFHSKFFLHRWQAICEHQWNFMSIKSVLGNVLPVSQQKVRYMFWLSTTPTFHFIEYLYQVSKDAHMEVLGILWMERPYISGHTGCSTVMEMITSTHLLKHSHQILTFQVLMNMRNILLDEVMEVYKGLHTLSVIQVMTFMATVITREVQLPITLCFICDVI